MRSVQIDLDRADFTLNPTSCEPFAVQSTIFGAEGAIATPSEPFPGRQLRRARLRAGALADPQGRPRQARPPGDPRGPRHRPGRSEHEAGLGRAADRASCSTTTTSGHLCTRVQFAADACPASSILGTARGEDATARQAARRQRLPANRAPTSFLTWPSTSGARSTSCCSGKSTPIKGGSLRTTFESVPDAPVEEFELHLAGGKKGLLQNSKGICGRKLRATVKMVGHNAAHHDAKAIAEEHLRQCRSGRSTSGAAGD